MSKHIYIYAYIGCFVCKLMCVYAHSLLLITYSPEDGQSRPKHVIVELINYVTQTVVFWRTYPPSFVFVITIRSVGGDSLVGIATRYSLDGRGIESRWVGIFHTRPDRPWRPPSLLYTGYRVSFPGVKRPGRSLDHSPPSSAEVIEGVELYFYSWPVVGWTLSLPLLFAVL
jgi:hypothetical protein